MDKKPGVRVEATMQCCHILGFMGLKFASLAYANEGYKISYHLIFSGLFAVMASLTMAHDKSTSIPIECDCYWKHLHWAREHGE